MNEIHKAKLKILAFSLILLLVGGFVGYTIANPSAATIYLEEGIYPGAPSYTIWVEGSTYYAKSAYGSIDYSGANASQIINAAIQALPSTPFNHGKIFISDGIYELSASIQPKIGTYIEGTGIGASLQAKGNFPVIDIVDVGYVTLSHLGLVGYSKDESDSYGVKITMGSKISLDHLYIYRSRAGVFVNGTFQTYISNLRVQHDVGSDQNYDGIKTVYNSARINEIIVSKSLITDVANTGVFLDGASGAYFEGVGVINSVEAAWYITNSYYLHFVQCFADSPTYDNSAGWYFQYVTGEEPHTIQMQGIWVGGYLYGMILENTHDITIQNFYAKDIGRNALEIKGNDRLSLLGGEIWGWDRGDSSTYSGIYDYSGSTDSIISGVTFYNTHTALYSIYANATRAQISDVNTYNAQIIRDTGTDTRLTSSWNATNWEATYP